MKLAQDETGVLAGWLAWVPSANHFRQEAGVTSPWTSESSAGIYEGDGEHAGRRYRIESLCVRAVDPDGQCMPGSCLAYNHDGCKRYLSKVWSGHLVMVFDPL